MSNQQRRGLGKGLGALIPTGPVAAPGGSTGAGARPGGPHRRAEAGRRRPLRGAPRQLDHPSTRASRASTSTSRRWQSSPSRSASSACCSRSSSGPRTVADTSSSWASAAGGRPRWPGWSNPGDRPRHRRRRPAPGRAHGEPPPAAAQPAGGGGRLPAAPPGLRRHPRAARPHRPVPPAHHQHAAPAEPAARRPAPGRRGVLSAGHARALLSLDGPAAQEHLAKRIVQKGSPSAPSRRSSRSARSTAGRTAPPRRQEAAPPELKELADRLSDLYETR